MTTEAGSKKLRGTAKKKAEVREILKNLDWQGFDVWASKLSSPVTILLGVLFDQDEEIKWRGIEAIGRVSKMQEENGNRAAVQETIKRLFWQMNEDCAGGIPCAPEALGEVLYNVPYFIREYGAGLLGYLMKEPFDKGVIWAAQRLSSLSAPLIQYKQMWFEGMLIDENSMKRAYAAKALLTAGFEVSTARKEILLKDQDSFTEYQHSDGTIKEITVAEILKTVV